MCDPNWETFQTLPHAHPYWRPVTPLVRVSGDTASGQEEGPAVPVDPPERQAFRERAIQSARASLGQASRTAPGPCGGVEVPPPGTAPAPPATVRPDAPAASGQEVLMREEMETRAPPSRPIPEQPQQEEGPTDPTRPPEGPTDPTADPTRPTFDEMHPLGRKTIRYGLWPAPRAAKE